MALQRAAVDVCTTRGRVGCRCRARLAMRVCELCPQRCIWVFLIQLFVTVFFNNPPTFYTWELS